MVGDGHTGMGSYKSMSCVSDSPPNKSINTDSRLCPVLNLKERTKNMIKKGLRLLSAILLIMPVGASSSDSIPDAHLRVTVQQRQDGKINKGLHVLELSCFNGNCSLSTVSLNQCGQSGSGKQAFYPAVQYSSTKKGNLEVRKEGNTIVAQETGSDAFGDYINSLRFDYDYEKMPIDGTIITHLTGFSGGFVKNSGIINKVFTADFVPLPKANQVMELDCGVLLPGIDKK